jgi:glycosyltransferase involved in cell wall biosynthesis
VFDVVLLYAPPWAGPTRFSKHHLASYFARRGARVLYVETPLTPFGLRRGRRFATDLRQALRPPCLVADRLWVRRHFLPVPYHSALALTSHRAANRVGQWLLAPVIRRDILGLGLRRPVLIAGLPHAADIVGLLPRRVIAYHCADDYAHVLGFPNTLPLVEADLCRQADLVITTSATLCEARRELNPETYWIPNGVDIDHFSKAATPADELGDVAHPVVGFVGGLSEWVDLELVAFVARERPDWTMILIGPIGIDSRPVEGLANVRLLGARDYATLPSYLAAMDVGLIPFKPSPVTYHADPIKAYEYLAAGLPVVATDLPALRRLAHVIRLADSSHGFITQIDAALAEGRVSRLAERQTEAARHSWTTRFERMERLIRAHLPCAS